MPKSKDLVEVGALWSKYSKAGKEYFSGKVFDKEVLMFWNSKKRANEKYPDYRLYLRQEKAPDSDSGEDIPF